MPSSNETSGKNLEIGLDTGIWGWKDTTIQKADSLTILRSAIEGDALIFAYGGPQPRVPAGGWTGVRFGRVIVARISSPYYFDESSRWPDDVYPHRIHFEVATEPSDSETLAPSICEALRLSANKQGSAVVAAADVLELLASPEPSAPTTLVIDGPTDAFTVAVLRKEQQRLRSKLLPGSSGECVLCGRNLPVGLLRAGHIKRRTEATHEERLDLYNVMAVCTLGCDELFERGYLTVDPTGIICSGTTSSSPDLSTFTSGLVGRRCTHFRPESAAYFEAHRQRISNG